jgi:hypothetical protein
MLNTIKHNLGLDTISGRLADEDCNRSGFSLLSKIPKITNLLNLSNTNANQVNTFKLKLKLANQEIDELKSTLKLVEKSYFTLNNVST